MISVFENTLLFLTSDNGARVLDHGQGQAGNNGMFKCGKGTTYEGGHRCQATPLIIDLTPSYQGSRCNETAFWISFWIFLSSDVWS